MIQAEAFLEPARSRGFDFWCGVPCSYLKPFINYVIDDPALTWLSAANEGDAVAAASGAALAGRRAVAIMQNSGLGNAVSPLSSLNWVFRIPVLLIVTLRGDAQFGDEPQHELMGQVTTGMLDTLQIPWRWFPDSSDDIAAALDAALAHMDGTGRPFALVMRKGQVAAHALRSPAPEVVDQFHPPGREAPGPGRPSRSEVLAALQEACPEQGSVLIATTGYTGRELYALADRPNQLYVVGSMGCASSLGLGLALARPDLNIVVADGDGAALMRMGNFASIGAYAGNNFAHVVLDNGQHESTGGQATVSHTVDFAAVAADCGYARARQCTTAAGVLALLGETAGPRFAHIRTRPGVPEGLPRPAVTPPQVRSRLLSQLGVQVPWGDTG